MAKNYRALNLRLILGLLLVIGVWLLVKCQCINLKAFVPSAIRDYIQSFGRFAVLAYIIAYALNTISVLPPIGALSLTAGLAFGTLGGAIYLMLGAMLGTTITFMISRFFCRGLVEKTIRGRFKDFDEKLEKNGFMTVLFFRVIPLIPYEVLNYACGLSKIRFRDYFFATFLGLIPGVIIASFFGGALGEIKGLKDVFRPRLLFAAGLMVIVIVIPIIYKFVKKQTKKDRI